ncbi:lactococcin 972 family bacteriocin [Paenarthrobacter sp. NPDC091669]|uniref:lactococcin 972 family bacteriocin n=1 Tax=Paenarthrobacter sp. NPDC091669 TaxID=3364384 RepID=UPI00380C767A
MQTKIKKIVLGGTLAVGLGLAGLGVAAPAQAATQYPGGGTWNYGNASGWNYSDFNIGYNHSSTVVCGNASDRKTAGPGSWSNAGLWAWSGCNYYYNF